LVDRKRIRLQNYDYSMPGMYFITICTDERKPLLGVVAATCGRPYVKLSRIGEIAENEIERAGNIYANVRIDKYIIMPEHIHMLIFIADEWRPQVAATDKLPGEGAKQSRSTPTISRFVKQFKGAVTKQIGRPIWQRSYIDRVVRNHAEYEEIWKYIENNPLKRYIRCNGERRSQK